MAALPLPVRLLYLVFAALAAPSPGRIPKAYNALITSNQNLQPSKAYPVYQPVLHDAFAFPYQPAVFYGDFPFTNGLLPAGAVPPKRPSIPQLPPAPAQPPAEEQQPTTANPADSPPSAATSDADQPSPPKGESSTSAPPPPPNTQSPIPLNEFGLPPQVLPLGRIDPAYNGFTQVGPFTYTYPNFRFYDPYDPFSFSPYANLSPLYRPLPNILEQSIPASAVAPGKVPGPNPEPAVSQSAQTPPPEPSDLNLLNYSAKDPAIPNVPPPPLPDGGLKSDKAE